MIGRRRPPEAPGEPERKSFDDFDLRLGDVMRGERATLGKSLLDVQRELKIKATYIAAIENADVSAFETPGFVAGYVRSYARYLGLDPEWAFETFCIEADFVTTSGADKLASAQASGPVYRRTTDIQSDAARDPIAQPKVSFAPQQPSPFSGLEPRAIGSLLVLMALIGAIGFGGWSVLKEVQRVQVTPVDRAPDAIAAVDPISADAGSQAQTSLDVAGVDGAAPDALDRLYRPRTLETPVMVARDGPIAGINPLSVGALSSSSTPQIAGLTPPPSIGAPFPTPAPSTEGATRSDAITAAIGEALGQPATPSLTTPRVTEGVPEVVLVAVRPAWVRVRSADGSTLFERTLQPGDTWVVPATEEPPTLRTGAAGAVFFAVNGQTYGPAGGRGSVVDQIALSSASLTQDFALADVAGNAEAAEAVAVAEAALGLTQPGLPDQDQ